MIRIELKPHVAKVGIQHPTTGATIGSKDVVFNQQIIVVRTTTAEGFEQPPFEFGYVGNRPGEPINQIPFRGMTKAAIDAIAIEVLNHINSTLVKPGEQSRRMFRYNPPDEIEEQDVLEYDTDVIEDEDDE